MTTNFYEEGFSFDDPIEEKHETNALNMSTEEILTKLMAALELDKEI